MRPKGHDRINVQNNPVNYFDPYGLLVWGVMGDASAGIIGAVDGSVAVLVEGAFNDVALSTDIAGSIGPQITADLGAGIVLAPFANKISDLNADSYRLELRAFIGIEIAVPKDNLRNIAISVDFLPGFDFGLGWGAGWTWLFGEDEPCE